MEYLCPRAQRDDSFCFGQIHKSTHSLFRQINPIRKISLRSRKKKIDGQASKESYKDEKVADRTAHSKLAIRLKTSKDKEIEKMIRPRWWSGGVAGAIAQCFTAPFDLIEARMVVIKKDRGMASSLQRAIRTNGFFSLYDGLSAQLVRQLTYTSLRFHLYEMGKEHLDDPDGLLDKVLVAGLAGCVAGVVGTPMELINTRMQVNRALPKETRWNYRNLFDGLYRVTRDEGFTKLYSGCLLSFMRSSLITISQNAAYDQAKQMYAKFFHMKHDNTLLHLISSVTAAFICGPIIKPIENLRYLRMVDSGRLLNSISYMMRFGTRGPFRGMMPYVLRTVPNTVITFLSFEQLRVHFGYIEIEDDE